MHYIPPLLSFFTSSIDHQYLHSFPTRRSSDLVPSFVSGAMAKAGKGLLEGTLQAGTSAVSDKLLDLVGLGGKSAADKGKDTRDYLAAETAEVPACRSEERFSRNAETDLVCRLL